MYPSNYLSWFRRLLILGAVVAGLTASAAGARLDPGIGTPPDVRDAAAAVSASQASFVSRPPDVRDAASSVNAAVPDVITDTLLAATAASPTESGQGPAYSLGPALLEYQHGTGFFGPKNTTSTPVRPDDRAGPLGVGEPTSVPASGGSDFAWDDWAIGVGAGIGIALLLGIGLVVGRQQRSRMQPA